MLDDAQCVCKASIVDANNRIISTGHAHETQGSSNINKTSYVENCETSAIGRALAMLGIGIDTSIASANEVADAIAKQDSKEKPPAKPVTAERANHRLHPNGGFVHAGPLGTRHPPISPYRQHCTNASD